MASEPETIDATQDDGSGTRILPVWFDYLVTDYLVSNDLAPGGDDERHYNYIVLADTTKVPELETAVTAVTKRVVNAFYQELKRVNALPVHVISTWPGTRLSDREVDLTTHFLKDCLCSMNKQLSENPSITGAGGLTARLASRQEILRACEQRGWPATWKGTLSRTSKASNLWLVPEIVIGRTSGEPTSEFDGPIPNSLVATLPYRATQKRPFDGRWYEVDVRKISDQLNKSQNWGRSLSQRSASCGDERFGDGSRE